MHKDKWIFYTDLFGSQRWEKVGTTGLTIAESQEGFPTLAAALADASAYGYQPGDDCTACALEWRRKPVHPFSVRDQSAPELLLVK